MQQDQNRLKIHTSARPAEEMIQNQRTQVPEKEQKETSDKPVSSQKKASSDRKRGRRIRRETGDRMTTEEKLLRNTAVACALLLTVMAMKNADLPWTQKAAAGIKQAMTMSIDWDETLGRLSFVRRLVPETALVFLNMGTGNGLIRPTEGEVSHEYTDQQPWLEYSCRPAEAVCAAMKGKVTAVGQSMSGDWTILIEGDEGRETVYGYLAGVYVQTGQTVERGQQIGMAADEKNARLYFELRENGEAVNPAQRMK